MPLEILVLDDEHIVGERLKAAIEKEGDHVEIFVNPIRAMERIENKVFDIVITDIRMDNISGIEILEQIQRKSRRTKVIMITGYATLEIARESMTKGAFTFIAKPFKLREMREAISKAAADLKTEAQNPPDRHAS